MSWISDSVHVFKGKSFPWQVQNKENKRRSIVHLSNTPQEKKKTFIVMNVIQLCEIPIQASFSKNVNISASCRTCCSKAVVVSLIMLLLST